MEAFNSFNHLSTDQQKLLNGYIHRTNNFSEVETIKAIVKMRMSNPELYHVLRISSKSHMYALFSKEEEARAFMYEVGCC